jgi:murein DD-endopeptidase MepM/ murein hydrolase activator NlpD
MAPRRIAALIAIVIACVASVVPVVAIAQTDEAAAERAAREIQEARNEANEAAEAFFQAESDLDVLKDEVGRLERDTDQLQAVVDRLRRDVESVAVARFVSSGVSGIPLLTGIQAPQDQVQAEVFVEVLTNSGGDALDAYDIAQKQLVTNESELADRKRDIEAQQVVFVALQKQAEDEVVRLRAFEEERLQDEAVQRALEARIAADRVELEEQARRQAETAARAIPDPAVGLPTTTSTLVPPSITVPDDAAINAETGVATEVTTTAPPETAPPTTAAPTNDGASGGTSGGRTGTGGSGSNPSPIDTGAGYLDTIICPMPGSAFADTWGAPRSGGRSHQGVDMIAPRGIPIYAVTSGFATFKSNRLGGNAVSLVGANGNRYYYAHLDSYQGASRSVSQGEVIGYNGDSGNARFSTPHLHFEIRPGGGLPTNPYPTVRAVGC